MSIPTLSTVPEERSANAVERGDLEITDCVKVLAAVAIDLLGHHSRTNMPVVGES
jgi:hypothetical protein